MIGLIDCNNFFVSCERLFRPDLAGKPVVVMSNNDGCAVAMSNEAKALGIKRGIPIYQIKQLIERYRVVTVPSNHKLYGNISSRVMATIGTIVPDIEIYSIDEAFLDMSYLDGDALEATGRNIVAKVRRDVGIPTSLGIAPTKTLAKIAARFAKKYPAYKGVCIIDNEEKRRKALSLIQIEDVWGIGRRTGKRLRQYNINSALDFADMSLSKVRQLVNITVERTWRELNDESCVDIKNIEPLNNQICATRSYKKSIEDVEQLKTAISDYCEIVALRLRRQGGCAQSVTVFIQTNSFRPELPQHYGSVTIPIEEATDDTLTLTSVAVKAVASLFRIGCAYRRAGVIVNEIVSKEAVQQSLFSVLGNREKRQRLMHTIDTINKNDETRGMVHSASSNTRKDVMRKEDNETEHKSNSAFLRIFYSFLLMLSVSFISWSAPHEMFSDTLANVVNLDEVIVKPGKEHYSKKNNPAVDFVSRIRENADLGDPMRKDNYNFERYECITLAINNITDTIGGGNGLMKKFSFLNEYVDTSEVTGRPILPISIKEKVSQIYNRKIPSATREYITGLRRKGVDDIINQDAIQTILEDFFREVDLYQNDITLLTNRFVSPLSKIGPDFYKYYLTDTIVVNNDSCAVLSFVPRNNATFGFVGKLVVALNDPTMFIRHVKMRLSPHINVNYVKTLNLEQSFERLVDGTRLKTSDVLTIEFEIIPNTQGLYAQKYTRYSGHNFDEADRPDLFNRLGQSYASADAFLKDDGFWNQYRGDVKVSEREIGTMLNDLRSLTAYKVFEKGLEILVSGYVPLGKNDKVEFGPVNTLVSFNDVEGARFRIGGVSTANLSKHWFGRGYAAYGTKDNKLKYYGELEYSFNEKKRHSREFPIHSLRLSHKYDTEAIGQKYEFTNPDNFFLSFKRMPDTLKMYQRTTALEYKLELENNLSITASISHIRQEATKYLPFKYSNGNFDSHLDFTPITLTLRYAPGEKYVQTKSHRIPVNLDAPIFQISHTYAPGGKLGGSKFTVNKTEVSFQKRFWLSVFGYVDAMLKGGHVWSTTPYTALLIPNANLSYTIQPECFNLLSPMEFITDSFVVFDFTYWANGAILNYVPYLKKLKLREVFAFRGVWGDLSEKNNPQYNKWLPQFPAGTNPVEMKSTPYMEISAGLDNIFRILRIDYVWRLSYRDTPGVDKSGLRLALHFNF